ncbi:MAG TPA: hypothetical protein VGR93_07920, partial [Candidatus Acidoferrales bacterium]|nr:hypothetical protein [Candidatus Acidoferrales bacterium]
MNRAFGAAGGPAPRRAAPPAGAGISALSKIGQRALECVPEECSEGATAPLPVEDDAPLLLPPPSNLAYDTLDLPVLPRVPPLAARPPPKCAPLLEACAALADACPPPWLCANAAGAITAKNSEITQVTKMLRKEGGTGAWVMKASREARLLYGTRPGLQKLR